MPPLTSVNIPFFFGRSPSSTTETSSYVATQPSLRLSSKGKAAGNPSLRKPAGRTYDDIPLPVKLVEDVSRKAQIQTRIIDSRGVWYQLKTELGVTEVSVTRILEHVSPQHLEEYEMKQFEEERMLISIAEAEERRIDREKAAAKKQRAKRKGIVTFEEISDSSDVESEQQNGRSRPTYAHMFQQPQKVRRRRKRDPRTGELMPLSDRESEDDMAMDMSEPMPSTAARRARAAPDPVMNIFDNPPKRRRRKRDPQSGELLPLSFEPVTSPQDTGSPESERQHTDTQPTEPLLSMQQQKRPRRRRHPQTGELMPLGWTWDGQASGSATRQQPGTGEISPSMNRLSLSHEHESKRQKVASSESSSSHSINIISFTSRVETDDVQSQQSNTYGSTSDDSTTHRSEIETTGERVATSKSLSAIPAMPSRPTSPPYEPSPNANTASPTFPNSMTSMLQPTPRAQAPPSSEGSSEHNDLEEGEFLIEAILAHHPSDPRTHDPEYGSEPIMLYKGGSSYVAKATSPQTNHDNNFAVRWYGDVVPKTTWEPIESFPDPSIVHDYQQRAGLIATNT
nr:hypothetical protein CFP56_07598 [Quercus suber]